MAPARALFTVALGSLAALVFAPLQPAAAAIAHAAAPQTIAPLPASNYTVSPACPPPAPGYASCLALRLVPQSAAARAHSRPLGMPRMAHLSASGTSTICEPPRASEGCYGLRPQDLHSAYSLPTNAPSEQTIALVDAYDDPNIEADLTRYDEEFGLPVCTEANGCFKKVNEHGESHPLPESEGRWAIEISLDVEVAHAICQSCHILLVEAENARTESLDTAEETAVKLGASEVSNSWGGSEPEVAPSSFDHPHTVITAASGDEGFQNWQTPERDERGGVDYPASSPYVVAVGGTRLTLSAGGAWSGETVWNGEGASGGGCSLHFEAQPWQWGLPNWPLGCGQKRALADVSADADPYTGAAVYDSATRVETPEGGIEPFAWRAIGGTSLASPLIAATFALAGGAGGVEYPAETLYERVASRTGTLHDVTQGSNGECWLPFDPETGLSGCTAFEAALSCEREAICLAGPAYDGPSGLGTPEGIGAFEAPEKPLREAQTVTFTSIAPSTATLGGPTYSPSATASSGLPVSFVSLSPGTCAVTGSTVSFKEAGQCTLEARQSGNATYGFGRETQAFRVGPGAQTIEALSRPPSAARVGIGYEASAIASSGLLVYIHSTTPTVCPITGRQKVYLATPGTCTIFLEQEGNANYKPAPPVEQTSAVAKGNQAITFTSIAPTTAVFGSPPYTVIALAYSGLPVSLSSATPSVCAIEGRTVSFLAGGTCTIDANQAGNADWEEAPEATQSFAVAKASQRVSFTSTAPEAATVAGSPYTPSATSSSGLPVSFTSATSSVCAIEGANVSFLAGGTCTIDAKQAGSADYNPAPEVNQSFTVIKRSQTIAFTSTAP
ncbi:MAG: S53 family peptidase, partial [Solirubrobacteraceae bacterium]